MHACIEILIHYDSIWLWKFLLLFEKYVFLFNSANNILFCMQLYQNNYIGDICLLKLSSDVDDDNSSIVELLHQHLNQSYDSYRIC